MRGYQREFSIPPFDLSHWDPSEQITARLMKHLKLPPLPMAIPYIYSDPSRKPRTLELLGFNSTGLSCSFVHSGTSATVLAAWWLRSIGVRHVFILCPAYFSVFYALEVTGIKYTRIYLRRSIGWRLPKEKILEEIGRISETTAVWLTNPVYCTGTYFSEDDVTFLESVLRTQIAFVADECLCLSGRELGSRFAWSDRFVAIYSPHKAVSVNAVKFAAVVASAEHTRFFDRWSDVLVGSLTASNYSAISHFCEGKNFSEFLGALLSTVEAVNKIVTDIVNDTAGSLEIDNGSIGHYISCYAPRISASKGLDQNFLRRLIWETGAVVIAGTTNHFAPEIGFSFKVNLARACPQFFASFHRLVNFLKAETEVG